PLWGHDGRPLGLGIFGDGIFDLCYDFIDIHFGFSPGSFRPAIDPFENIQPVVEDMIVAHIKKPPEMIVIRLEVEKGAGTAIPACLAAVYAKRNALDLRGRIGPQELGKLLFHQFIPGKLPEGLQLVDNRTIFSRDTIQCIEGLGVGDLSNDAAVQADGIVDLCQFLLKPFHEIQEPFQSLFREEVVYV
ncbi:MAG: hypothetical protein QG552_3655, partial [Thermodesulfobacteriota bacterium]|nr:hypothetical protein [Thermodesulfobacteriota bacterium]